MLELCELAISTVETLTVLMVILMDRVIVFSFQFQSMSECDVGWMSSMCPMRWESWWLTVCSRGLSVNKYWLHIVSVWCRSSVIVDVLCTGTGANISCRRCGLSAVHCAKWKRFGRVDRTWCQPTEVHLHHLKEMNCLYDKLSMHNTSRHHYLLGAGI